MDPTGERQRQTVYLDVRTGHNTSGGTGRVRRWAGEFLRNQEGLGTLP